MLWLIAPYEYIPLPKLVAVMHEVSKYVFFSQW